MIYNFSEMKQQNDQLENRLQQLKKEYHKQQMSAEQLKMLLQKMGDANAADKNARRKKKAAKLVSAVAALAAAFVILPNTSGQIAYAMEQIPILGRLVEVVTFRDYKYESVRHSADIEVPEIVPGEKSGDSNVDKALERSLDEINSEIQSITDEITEEFKTYLEDEEGYQDVVVKSEVLATTEDYFTLKLLCYQGAGSGYQWNYYYTVDLTTGKRLQLKDLFVEGADYITPISENIKQQMREQMAADEMVYYWLDEEFEEWNFSTITDETSFYLNEKGNIVIGFNEGDVAPMYMGTVEFEIPPEVLSNIRK